MNPWDMVNLHDHHFGLHVMGISGIVSVSTNTFMYTQTAPNNFTLFDLTVHHLHSSYFMIPNRNVGYHKIAFVQVMDSKVKKSKVVEYSLCVHECIGRY